MVSFRLGEKRSIDAAGNAASGHKMFIAAESDFSGGKVWSESENGDEADAEMQTAARMGGGSCMRCVMFITTGLLHLHAHKERVARIGWR